MSQEAIDLVFVHGWSVSNTDTYGGLPERLVNDAHRQGVRLRKQHIYLGRYISFHDEVRVKDIAAAMQAAVADNKLGKTNRFFCITHSTGGPVVREWVDRYYANKRRICPMSHLVMLAPANFGSALAQLGKGRLGRMKSWFDDAEPGQGVLDWLELGSTPAFELNKNWIHNGQQSIGPSGHFPFVVTGQQIDRKLYDILNTYTGESGSDGVVRVAAANLGSSYVCLKQYGDIDAGGYNRLRRMHSSVSPHTPMRVVHGKSHSGKDKGIMRSIKKTTDSRGSIKDRDTIESILRCLLIKTRRQYDALAATFDAETAQVQREERVEVEDRRLVSDRTFIHDRYSQIIFRVMDTEGHPVLDYDLLLTAGDDSDPNHLPKGFFCDRQRNRNNPNIITYFVNYDVMAGTDEIPGVRGKLDGMKSLGFILHPRPEKGFVHYRKCRIPASTSLFKAALKPNQTTLVDIILTRVVHKETFRFDRTLSQRNFSRKAKPGSDTVS